MIELKASRRTEREPHASSRLTSPLKMNSRCFFFPSSLSRLLVEKRRGETDEWERSSCVTSISAAGLQ